jgi:hypothetical protein
MRRVETAISALAAAFGLAALGLVFHRLALTLLGDMNSDSLFLAQFARDVVTGAPLRDWVLQPAPSFFPDGLLMAISQLLSRDIRTAIYVYHALFLLVFVGSMIGIAKAVTDSWWRAILAVVAPALIFAYETSGTAMARNFGLPGHHGMSTVMAVVSLLLFVRTIRRPLSGGYLAFFAAVQLGTASCDKLYILVGILPLLVTVLASVMGKALRFRDGVGLMLPLAAALPAPFALDLLTRKLGMFTPVTRTTPDWSLGRVVHALDLLNAHAATHPAFAWSFALLCVLGPAAVFACFGRRRALQTQAGFRTAALGAVMTFFASSVAANLLGVAFGGFLVDPYRVRYLEAVWVLPLFALSILCCGWAASSIWTRLAVPLALLLQSWVHLRSVPPRALPVSTLGLYDPATQCIDQAANETGYRRGYATYWHARKQSLMSRQGVEFAQITADFRVHQWITNLHGHRVLAAEPPGFLVYLADADEGSVRGALGQPASERACGPAKLWIYKGAPRTLPRGVIIARSLTEATLQW